MKTLRQSLLMVVIVMASVCASDMVSIADNYSGGGHSGGSYRGGGHSGGYYGGGSYYRGGHYGGYYRGGDFGVVIGVPYWGASWYSPYYYPNFYPSYYPYDAPAVTVPSEPKEYIMRSQGESSQGSSGVWYFCPESKAYYPYIRECPGGWQTVPAQPPSESGR